MRKTRAQVSSSPALHTPFWLGTFSERGYAFSRRMSRDLSLGITVKLSCTTVRRYAPLESWWLGLSSRIWLYIKYKWVLFGFFFYFKDIPVVRNHEKGQHPSRTIVEILEESSVSPLWSCKNFDYNGSLWVKPKQRGFVPPCTDVQDDPRNPSTKAWKAGNCFDSLMALVPKLP